MANVVWSAKLSDEEWEKATDEILSEICERLDNFWEELKETLL